MKRYMLAIAIIFVFATDVRAQKPGDLQLRTAEGHPMQYYVSLPSAWTPDKRWPVVVVIESASKEYQLNAQGFANARGEYPFIIVAPYIVTNGNQGLRDPQIFPYSVATWDWIDKVGKCRFDEEGLLQVLADVRKMYNGEDKIYMTGFEAGAHLVWTFVFRHPGILNGAVPVAGNYRGRCMEDGQFSADDSRQHLPIRAFYGALDADWAPGGKVYYQWEDAKSLALAHGYSNVSEMAVPGKAHVAVPDTVLSYFNTLYRAAHKP